MRIGIDSGGTFTDFVVLDDDGRLSSFKLRSSRAAPGRRSKSKAGMRRVYTGGRWIDVPCYRREQTGVSLMAGPALVLDHGSTVLVPDQWKFRLAEAGNLILSND